MRLLRDEDAACFSPPPARREPRGGEGAGGGGGGGGGGGAPAQQPRRQRCVRKHPPPPTPPHRCAGGGEKKEPAAKVHSVPPASARTRPAFCRRPSARSAAPSGRRGLFGADQADVRAATIRAPRTIFGSGRATARRFRPEQRAKYLAARLK